MPSSLGGRLLQHVAQHQSVVVLRIACSVEEGNALLAPGSAQKVLNGLGRRQFLAIAGGELLPSGVEVLVVPGTQLSAGGEVLGPFVDRSLVFRMPRGQSLSTKAL